MNKIINKVRKLSYGKSIKLYGQTWIKWKTEEKGKYLLVLSQPLEGRRAFDEKDNPGYARGNGYGINDWEKSDLKNWLNTAWRGETGIQEGIEIAIPSKEEFEANWNPKQFIACWLWTRSPYASSTSTAWLVHGGSSTYSVIWNSTDVLNGVLPAIWLSSEISKEKDQKTPSVSSEKNLDQVSEFLDTFSSGYKEAIKHKEDEAWMEGFNRGLKGKNV